MTAQFSQTSGNHSILWTPAVTEVRRLCSNPLVHYVDPKSIELGLFVRRHSPQHETLRAVQRALGAHKPQHALTDKAREDRYVSIPPVHPPRSMYIETACLRDITCAVTCQGAYVLESTDMALNHSSQWCCSGSIVYRPYAIRKQSRTASKPAPPLPPPRVNHKTQICFRSAGGMLQGP